MPIQPKWEKIMRTTTFLIVALAAIPATAEAEPVGRWWSGGGMGQVEYGYTRNDNNKILFSCDPQDGSMSVFVTANGRSPRKGSRVQFDVNGQTIRWRAGEDGNLDTGNGVERSSYYSLLKQIARGKTTLRVSFDGTVISFPLRGSAREMPRPPCSA